MEFNKKDIKIYILTGKARSGKDTFANKMIDALNNKGLKAIKIAYASYLKEYAKNILGWDGSDDTKPRKFLQEIGVQLIKDKIDDKMLINRILEDILVYSYFYDVIIISDARFESEINSIKDRYDNVKVIHLKEKVNDLTEEEKNHITETSLDEYHDYDYEVDQNTNVESVIL